MVCQPTRSNAATNAKAIGPPPAMTTRVTGTTYGRHEALVREFDPGSTRLQVLRCDQLGSLDLQREPGRFVLGKVFPDVDRKCRPGHEGQRYRRPLGQSAHEGLSRPNRYLHQTSATTEAADSLPDLRIESPAEKVAHPPAPWRDGYRVPGAKCSWRNHPCHMHVCAGTETREHAQCNVVHGSSRVSAEKGGRSLLEGALAAGGAEVEGFAIDLCRELGGGDIDLHVTHRIDGGHRGCCRVG